MVIVAPPSFRSAGGLLTIAILVGPFAAFVTFFASVIFTPAILASTILASASAILASAIFVAAFVGPTHRLISPVRMSCVIARGGVVHSCRRSLGRCRRTGNIGGRVRSGRSGCHHSTPVELSRPGSGSDRRPTMVFRCEECAVRARDVFVLNLFSGRCDVSIVHCHHFGGSGSCN